MSIIMTRRKAISEGFTHWCWFYGIPGYFKDVDNGNGCAIVGRNILCDWLIEYAVPVIHWVVETFLACVEGDEHEPRGWRIELRGHLGEPPAVEPR